jgi:hypothetical protein
MTPPGSTSKEIPRKAGSVSRDIGWSIARHPLAAGGKYFSRFSTHSARVFTNRRYILSNAAKQALRILSTQYVLRRIAVAVARPSRYNSQRQFAGPLDPNRWRKIVNLKKRGKFQ